MYSQSGSIRANRLKPYRRYTRSAHLGAVAPGKAPQCPNKCPLRVLLRVAEGS